MILKNPLQPSFQMWEDITHTQEFLPAPAPKTVYFDASSSSIQPGYGEIVNYSWDFGDGNTSEGQFTSHTFNANGFYTVTLTVSSGNYASSCHDLVRVGQSVQAVHISDPIDEDTKWTGYFYYLIQGSIIVTQGATLTIDQGTEIRAAENAELRIDGTLIAKGTAEQAIVFTSGSNTPSRGDWGGIRFTDTSTGNILDHVLIRYASFSLDVDDSEITLTNSTITDNGSNTAVTLDNATATLTGNSITANDGGGVSLNSCQAVLSNNNLSNNQVHGISISSCNPEILNNTISNNGGIGIFASENSFPIITGNIISGNGSWSMALSPFSDDQVSENSITNSKGIYLHPGTIAGDVRWDEDSVYIVSAALYPNYSITVNQGVTLTIPSGKIIKFMKSFHGGFGGEYFYKADLEIKGNMIAEGLSEKPIVFTSFLDDDYGGDINSDGNCHWAL